MEDDAFNAYWRGLTVIAFLLLTVAPAMFLYVMYVVKPELRPTYDAFPPWLYIAYVMPLLDIISHLAVRKALQRSGKGVGHSADTFAIRYRRFAVIRMAKPPACYCYGLVIFFLTGQIKQMWYFYTLGILMTPFAWPRKREYFDFLLEAQAP